MKNVGDFDRKMRIIVGVLLLVGFAINPGGGWHLLYLLGIIPLVTGLMRSCPAYSIFGINTCCKKD
jgi:hypothetical protein